MLIRKALAGFLLSSMAMPALATEKATKSTPAARKQLQKPAANQVALDVTFELLEGAPGVEPTAVQKAKAKVVVERGKEVLVWSGQRPVGGESHQTSLFVKIDPSEIPAAVKVSFRAVENKGDQEVFTAKPEMVLKFAAAGELEETLKSSRMVRMVKIRVSAEEGRRP